MSETLSVPETGTPVPEYGDERKRAYLNVDGLQRPLRAPITAETIERARVYRLRRLREQTLANDCAAILLYSPINIRYAFDYTNMQIWTMHEPVRYALIFAEGPAIMFEFKGCHHLAENGAGIDELRTAISWLYMSTGERSEQQAAVWAAEIDDLMRRYGGGNRRLAIDRIDPLGIWALDRLGIEYLDGHKVTEHARVIKSADELALMRWTIATAERGMWRIRALSVPGMTENELLAELHHENIRSGGEWFETKLLTSGPRTNPWYQEASHRVISAGEMIAFDTDMVGPYGYCADISRSWTCGLLPMTDRQAGCYRAAREQIEHNMALLRPGLSFAEFNQRSWRIPEKHIPYRYSLALHGAGLVDEWPIIPLHVDTKDAYGSRKGRFAENMVICVESLIAEEGSESVKLETQVLITKDGPLRLDSFPWEDAAR